MNRRCYCSVMRRLICLFAAFLMLCPSLFPSYAAQTVYFTAGNNRLLDLNSASMPFVSDDVYYLPHTIFQNTGLGIYFSRSVANQTASLYTSGITLTFDLEHGLCYDSQGTEYPYRAVVKGDYVFFPLTLLTVYFGLSYSIIPTDYAPIIRIKGGTYLSDRIFLDAAGSMLSTRYTQYQKSLTEQNTDTPAQPGTSEDIPGKYALCPVIRVSDSDSLSASLDLLDAYGWTGLFLFRPSQLDSYHDLLRRICAGGHSVGFTGQYLEASHLDSANEKLSLITGCKSRVVYLPTVDNQHLSQLSLSGYCPLQPTDLSQSDLNTASAVNSLLRSYRSSQIQPLFFGDSQAFSRCGDYLLRRLKANQYYCTGWREIL